jgi:phenazine biosynthesis protein phzE
MDLAYKDIVFQGTQSRVRLEGREENVGFYNTFVARAGGTTPEGVELFADPVPESCRTLTVEPPLG